MTRTTPRLCGILCAAALVVALAGESAAVECRLAPNGSITTWLVTPPFRFDHRAGFEKDLLPANMGERTGLRRSEGPGKVAWRGMSAGRSFVELSERCRDRGESVFYAACELRATAPGTYILEAAFWARLAIWLDGRPLVSDEAGKEDAVFARCQAKVKLPDRRPRHLLVKLGSRSQQAFFRVALWKDAEAPGTEREPAPVRCLLRVPEGRIGGLVAGSLKISSSTGGVVYAGKPLRITAKIQAGRPLVDGPVRLHAKMLDGAGRTVKAFEPVAVELDAPGGAAARYAWTVPDSVKERSYTFEATVRFRGQAAGTLRQTVHVAEALGDWMKQLGRRSDKLGDELGPRIYTEPDFALARLRHEKAVQYARAGEFGGSRPDKVAEELAGWERALGRLDRHKSRPIEPGLSEHAYLSMIDDSPQPYYVYVPKGHDGQTRLPLIVYLHGYSPDLNKLNWGMIPRDLLHYCDDRGYYLVAPFGRSNTDFQGIGEADVLHVLMLANKRLPVRADRVFLFGYSMGGMGVFTIGAHYPDLWAGIVSVSGRADYYLWREYERDRVEPYKRHLIDREFGAEMLGNFKNIPILICHGGDDSLVKVEQPRRLKRRLAALGGDVSLRILPGRDHWIMSQVLAEDRAFRWMDGKRQNPWPRRIDFKTYSIKYRSAHWVTILELARWGRPARVRATLNADKTAMDVTTTNVASLRLDLSKHLVGEKPDLVVRIDGKEHRVAEPGPRTFDLSDREHAGELRKTPRVCGPAKQVYARRFLMVFGAGEGKKADVERLRGEVQSAGAEWYQFAKGIPLRKLDVQITEDDIKQANLILYGTPGRNKVLKRVADRLPIRITDDGFTFRGKTYDNETHGLVMVYPNPLNPDRLVMVRSGLPYGEALPPNHKYDLLPDFVIFKAGTDYDDTDRAVVAGFFDRDWRVSERLIWRRGDRAPGPRLNPEPAPVERHPIGVP